MTHPHPAPRLPLRSPTTRFPLKGNESRGIAPSAFQLGDLRVFRTIFTKPEGCPGQPLAHGPGPAAPRGGAPPAAALTPPVKMSSPSESLSGGPSPRCSGKGGGRRSAGEGERDPWLPPDAIAAASARARHAGSARHALTRGAGPRLRPGFRLGSVSTCPAPDGSGSQ